MPKIDLELIAQSDRTAYPPPFDRAEAGRLTRRLAPAFGLTLLGASQVVLKPGAWSSQRHWHDDEDELLVMLSGEAVLVEDNGRTILRAGDICAWPKGVRNGHHLRNEGTENCAFIAISAGPKDGTGGYSDIDLMFDGQGFLHKDGSRYDNNRST